MKSFTTFLSKCKWILIGLAIFTTVLFIASFISFTQVSSFHSGIIHINGWITKHTRPILFYHAVLILSIYLIWGAKVKRQAKRFNWTPEEVKRVKRFRYFMIAFVIFIDYLVFWH